MNITARDEHRVATHWAACVRARAQASDSLSCHPSFEKIPMYYMYIHTHNNNSQKFAL